MVRVPDAHSDSKLRLPVLATWGEIGAEIGVSRQRAQNIAAGALRKIEDRCKERGITFDDLMPPPAEQSLLDDLAMTRREWF